MDIDSLLGELTFKTSRSSGKGGQNVNKVSTKVEVRFNIPDSDILTPLQKELLQERLDSRLTRQGELIITCTSERSQLANKKKAIQRFLTIIEKALRPEIKRVPTSRSRASVERRLEEKKLNSGRKGSRKKINPSE